MVHTFATSLSALLDSEYEILVITGAWREAVEAEVADLAKIFPVRVIYNASYRKGGMLSSIQTGISSLTNERAGLIGLADQPQAEEATIRIICKTFLEDHSSLVIPSFHGHRGHPWLVARSLWADMLSLSTATTSRDFLRMHESEIQYLNSNASILEDLDTPQEYEMHRPKG